MRWTRAAVAATVLLVSGCAPQLLVTPLGGTYPPRRPAQELAVFSTHPPECPYEELALLTAFQGDLGRVTEMDHVLAAFKERARSLGADAVVGLRHVNDGGAITRDGYTGTAIRFTDEACMR